MKPIFLESSSGGSVASAVNAYRAALAKHGLVEFDRQEILTALATLQSQGCEHVGPRDIRFQAAATRLEARKNLSSKSAEGILSRLVELEYDLDQAEWEHDCHRRASLSHSTFKLPKNTPRPASSAK